MSGEGVGGKPILRLSGTIALLRNGCPGVHPLCWSGIMAPHDPAAGPLPPTPHQRPTAVRHGVLGFLCVLSFILYLDRICISQAAEDMRRDLDLSKTAMGLVFGAFTIAYGLFEVPTGRLGDRFGSRGVLVRVVLWWSAFTALTGCVQKFTFFDSGWELRLRGVAIPLALDSLVLLIVIRFLFGAGEAGALPNAARVIARWFPPGRRGAAQGALTTSALLGGAAAPVLTAYLIRQTGWRLSFMIFGSLGIVWAVAFSFWFRDDPAEHPGVNEAERKLLGAAGAPNREPHPPVPWGRVLSSPNVWLLGGVITCSAFTTYMYISWYPTYLQSARGVHPVTAGWLASLVLAGGAVGCVLGGFVTDWLRRKVGVRRWPLRTLAGCGLTAAAAAMALSIHIDDPYLAAGLTAAACFSVHLHLTAWWAAVTEISGKHLGTLFGLMNSMGVPGATASQLFLGWFADWRQGLGYSGRAQWDPAFYVYAYVLLLGALGWLLIDPTRSVVERRPETEAGSLGS
jgi:sugar phosphate permease